LTCEEKEREDWEKVETESKRIKRGSLRCKAFSQLVQTLAPKNRRKNFHFKEEKKIIKKIV